MIERLHRLFLVVLAGWVVIWGAIWSYGTIEMNAGAKRAAEMIVATSIYEPGGTLQTAAMNLMGKSLEKAERGQKIKKVATWWGLIGAVLIGVIGGGAIYVLKDKKDPEPVVEG